MSSAQVESAAPPDAPAATAEPQLPSTSRPNLDGILLLEQPFARVPFDELRRQQRTQQRLVEREMMKCSSSLNELESKVARGAGASDSASREEAQKTLDAMLGRLRGLKRKMLPIAQQSKQTLRMAQSRTDHLGNLHSIDSASSPEFAEWSKTRLDRMLVDYMLRRGYRRSADELAASRGVQDLVDADLFAEIATIEHSLVPPGWGLDAEAEGEAIAGPSSPSCTLALAWCSENKATLRKIKSPLEFDLRLQEFIELARVRTPESLKEAIAYLRRYLIPTYSGAVASLAALPPANAGAADKESKDDIEFDRSAYEAVKKQVARAMGLIACGPDGWAYEDLYTPYRWLSLRDSFRVCALQIHSLPLQPILHIALSAGLSSLKVPACYSHEVRAQNGAGEGVASGAPAHLGGRTAADAASAALLGDTANSGGHADTVSVPSRFPPAMGGSLSGSSALDDIAATGNSLRAQTTASPLSYLGSMTGSGITPHPHTLNVAAATAASQRSRSPAAATAAATAGGNAKAPMTDDRNIDCPVCDTDGLGTLAREVPWSHHANSTLVCSLSGKVMDENNPPMALPNGRVYAMSALEEMAAKSRDSNTVVCPRTGESFTFSSLRKVFIS